METITEKINIDLAVLNDELTSFIKTHSRLRQIFFPGDMSFSTSGDSRFEDLTLDAIPVQDRLYKKFNKIVELVEMLLSDSPERHLKEFHSETENVIESILQNKMTWCKSTNEVATKSSASLEKIKDILNSLFIKSDLPPLLIPDTNALYTNIEIEKWKFDQMEKFDLIITPSVLKDLDKHKIDHRNENVRTKALKLINKIKEYRRRGKLTEGVVLVKEKVNLKTIAVEPNFSKTLNWLDPFNEDDRLIAEILELIKANCNRPVIIITSDINLQNKCEFVDLPFIEPPTSE
jgi:hypothetical protein